MHDLHICRRRRRQSQSQSRARPFGINCVALTSLKPLPLQAATMQLQQRSLRAGEVQRPSRSRTVSVSAAKIRSKVGFRCARKLCERSGPAPDVSSTRERKKGAAQREQRAKRRCGAAACCVEIREVDQRESSLAQPEPTPSRPPPPPPETPRQVQPRAAAVGARRPQRRPLRRRHQDGDQAQDGGGLPGGLSTGDHPHAPAAAVDERWGPFRCCRTTPHSKPQLHKSTH
jgi:hypothetical protein